MQDNRTREGLLLLGFVLLCAAGVLTVLLPETRDDDAKAAGAAGASARTEASPAAARP